MAMHVLNNIERGTEQQELCNTTPSLFIERYCSKLGVPNELILLSKFVASKLEQNGAILDNTPHSIAAGVVYFIAQNCNLNISKQDIKKICGVSEVTINKCYKKMEVIKEQLIPACLIDKYV
jgi:transcription initiation factor TFIIB